MPQQRRFNRNSYHFHLFRLFDSEVAPPTIIIRMNRWMTFSVERNLFHRRQEKGWFRLSEWSNVFSCHCQPGAADKNLKITRTEGSACQPTKYKKCESILWKQNPFHFGVMNILSMNKIASFLSIFLYHNCQETEAVSSFLIHFHSLHGTRNNEGI